MVMVMLVRERVLGITRRQGLGLSEYVGRVVLWGFFWLLLRPILLPLPPPSSCVFFVRYDFLPRF